MVVGEIQLWDQRFGEMGFGEMGLNRNNMSSYAYLRDA